MTQIISVAIMNLVTPKVGARYELLFNKPASVDWLACLEGVAVYQYCISMNTRMPAEALGVIFKTGS